MKKSKQRKAARAWYAKYYNWYEQVSANPGPPAGAFTFPGAVKFV